jgi:hypothetical protein
MILYTGKAIRLYIILALSLILLSCDKGSEEDIPSYISLNSIWLNPEGVGTSSQKITDAWIYVDDEFIGAFELPFVKVPVLKAGKHHLKIYPGIKMNGIASTRVPYAFYSSVEKEINLVRDSIVNLGSLPVKYSPGIIFAWQEDFEQSTISLDTTKRSIYKLERTFDTAFIFKPPTGEYNSSSGRAIINSDSGIFECASHDAFVLPVNGRDVFLELNYKTNNSVTVGIFVNTASQTIQEPLLVLNRNTTWNKIYINLTAAVVQHQNAIDFKIFFGIIKDSDVAEAQFLVDNIKLVHF